MKDLLLHKYRFYTLTFAGLVIWMLFFDINDVFTQINMYRELGRLEDEKKYYVQKIKEVEKERIEVMGNKKLVEKFAREKYLMKKPQEEIFVIVGEDNQPLEKQGLKDGIQEFLSNKNLLCNVQIPTPAPQSLNRC